MFKATLSNNVPVKVFFHREVTLPKGKKVPTMKTTATMVNLETDVELKTVSVKNYAKVFPVKRTGLL
jgi:hypothetical protein